MLPQHTRELILKLKAQNRSNAEIVEIVGVSERTITRIVNNQDRKTGKKRGRPPMLTNYEKLNIKRAARNSIGTGKLVNSRIIKQEAAIEASRRTICRQLIKQGFRYKKIKKQLALSKSHLKKRHEFARLQIAQNTNWKTVVFSDEKRFCKDGPDNESSYVEIRGTKTIAPKRVKRQMKGGGIMVLGAITSTGKLKLKVIRGKYKSQNYLDDLQQTFIPWIRQEFGQNHFIWQQDNAPIHKANIITEYLANENIQVMEWPALSCDLNIIENVWHLMELEIYRNGQYNTIEELTLAVEECARNFDPEAIKSLYNSMGNRILKVYDTKGAQIH